MSANSPWPLIDPPYDFPAYRLSRLRAPKLPLVVMPKRLLDATGPVFGESAVGPGEQDLTRQHAGEPQGQRIVVAGSLLDEDGRPIVGQLIEIWQANAAGRYAHDLDQHPTPLDPNFTGTGRCLTGPDGSFRFITIQPGAYPWRNHDNAWRPAHIHFSVFGRSFAERLVTQMYFPGDPLLDHDPIYQSVTDPRQRQRLLSALDMDLTEPEWAIGYRWNIVVGRHHGTPFESGRA